jgi:hypothetical protein
VNAVALVAEAVGEPWKKAVDAEAHVKSSRLVLRCIGRHRMSRRERDPTTLYVCLISFGRHVLSSPKYASMPITGWKKEESYSP